VKWLPAIDQTGVVAAVVVCAKRELHSYAAAAQECAPTRQITARKPSAAALRPLVGQAGASNRFHEPRRVCAQAKK